MSEITYQQIIDTISSIKYEYPKLPEYKPSFFERLMNRIGWYRKTTVYVLDINKLKASPTFCPKIDWRNYNAKM